MATSFIQLCSRSTRLGQLRPSAQPISYLQRFTGPLTVLRALTTTNKMTSQSAWAQYTDDPNPIVRRLNKAFYNYPIESVASILGQEIITIYGSYVALKYLGVEVSSDFALAFALSRPFRRLRLPLELATAAGLSRIFPALTRIHFSHLASAMPTLRRSVTANSSPVRRPSVAKRGAIVLIDAIDKYGAAYFIGARLVGLGTVLTLYGALDYGIDIPSLLTSLGLEGANRMGNVFGTWAAAVVLSSSLFPFTFALSGWVAPALGTMRKTLLKM